MRQESINWIKINKRLLRFGDLSRHQRNVLKFDVKPNEALLKCEDCNKSVIAKKIAEGEGWEIKDNRGEWQGFRKKSPVLEDDKKSYYMQADVEFYCSSCLLK